MATEIENLFKIEPSFIDFSCHAFDVLVRHPFYSKVADIIEQHSCCDNHSILTFFRRFWENDFPLSDVALLDLILFYVKLNALQKSR